LNRRSFVVWGVAATFLLLCAGAAVAQQKGPYDTSGQDGGLWLIEGASTYTKDVDILYKVIFWVIIVMFVLTEGLLIYFCIVYRRRPGHRPIYTHGNRKAELTWTIVPACMLLALAIVQIKTWNEIKLPDLFPKPGPGVTTVDVFAEQFAWNYRYPQALHAYKAPSDLTTGQLLVPFGDKVVCRLRSRDVIHSLFIPHMRTKQDTVPGLRQGLWFEPARIWLADLKSNPQKRVWVNNPQAFDQAGEYFDKRVVVNTYVEDELGFSPAYDEEDGVFKPIRKGAKGQEVEMKVNVLHRGQIYKKQDWASCDYAVGIFEVACAELCGLGHYKMKSRLNVLPRAAYDQWVKEEEKDIKDFSDVRKPPPVWNLWRE